MFISACRFSRLGAGMIGGWVTLALPNPAIADAVSFSRAFLAGDPAQESIGSTPIRPSLKKKNPPHGLRSTTPEHMQVRFKRKPASGGGMFATSNAPRTVQAVTKQYIAMRSPTSTPLDLVQQLPSLNVSSPDPSGMEGGAINIRGLDDSDLAMLLNGTNTTPSLYFNEISDPENLQSVVMTPGSSTIDLPSTSAAAGVLNVIQADPSKTRSGLMDFTYGANALSREFIRMDTGEIGHTGFSSFFSFSHADSHPWMGAGRNDRKHIDFGLKKTWANGSSWKVFTTWNGERFTLDNFPNEAQFKNYKHDGAGWGQSGSWNAPPPYPGDEKCPNTTDKGISNNAASCSFADNYYKANTNAYNQLFISAPFHLHISRRASFDLNPFLNFGRGWAGGGSGHYAGANNLYDASGNKLAQDALLTSTWQDNQARTVGLVAKINYKIGRHNDFKFGYWYQNSIDQSALVTTAIQSNGAILNPNYGPSRIYTDSNRRNPVKTINNPGYEVNSFFIQNGSHYLHDRLSVLAGFKYVMSNYWYKTKENGQPYPSLGYNPTAPLPQFSVGYKINRNHQVYLNAEGDFNQPAPGNLRLAQGRPLPKTEYSIKEEAGYRYNHRYFMIDASFFNYNITNRLFTTCADASCSYSTTGNMGNMTSRGFDAVITGRPWRNWSPYASIEYLYSRIDSNTPYAGSYLLTKGVRAPNAPHVLANFGLSYGSSTFFGNFGMHYAGPQSVTLMDDQRIPGSITDNMSIGYHMPSPAAFIHSPVFKLNFNNLTGAIVRTAAKGMAVSKNPATLLNGQTAPGSGQGAQFYAVPRFSMSGTISAGF